MLQTQLQRGQGLADCALLPVSVTITKRDWLKLMQVCREGCEPDQADWVTRISQRVQTAITQTETFVPYSPEPKPEPDDLYDWLNTLIKHADQD
jgi:hypothetical protein